MKIRPKDLALVIAASGNSGSSFLGPALSVICRSAARRMGGVPFFTSGPLEGAAVSN